MAVGCGTGAGAGNGTLVKVRLVGGARLAAAGFASPLPMATPGAAPLTASGLGLEIFRFKFCSRRPASGWLGLICNARRQYCAARLPSWSRFSAIKPIPV